MAEKFLNDMYDWQRPNGKLPQIAPDGGVDFYMGVMNGSVGWADAGRATVSGPSRRIST